MEFGPGPKPKAAAEPRKVMDGLRLKTPNDPRKYMSLAFDMNRIRNFEDASGCGCGFGASIGFVNGAVWYSCAHCRIQGFCALQKVEDMT